MIKRARDGDIDAVVPSSANVRRVTKMRNLRPCVSRVKKPRNVRDVRLEELILEQALVKHIAFVGLYDEENLCTITQ